MAFTLLAKSHILVAVEMSRAHENSRNREGESFPQPATTTRLREILDRVGVGLAEMDTDGRILRANQRIGRMFGEVCDRLVGRRFIEYVNAQERASAEADLIMARAGAELPAREVEFLRPDGEIACGRVTLATLNANVIATVEDITIRRTTEKKATAAEQKWTTALRASPIAVLISSADTSEIFEVNPAFERIFGYTRDAVVGRRSIDMGLFIDPTVRAGFVKELREKGTVHLQDVRIRHKDESTRLVCGIVVPIEFDGRPAGLTMAYDVTTQRRLEASAREGEQRWTAVGQATPHGISIERISDGKIVEVNPAMERLFGYRRDELIGRTTRELGLVVQWAHREQVAKRIQEQGRGTEEAMLFRRQNGEEFVGRVSCASLMVDGEVCLCTAMEDITERYRAEALVRAREETLRRAFDSAPIGIAFAVPGEQRWKEVNEQLACMLGYTRDELLEKNILELTHPDDRERDRNTFGIFARGEAQVMRWTKRLMRKDGSVIDCEIQVSASPRIGDEKVHTVAAIQDITSKVRAEAERLETEARWSATVAASTQAIIIASIPDFRVMDVNPALEALSGLKREEILGHTAPELSLEFEGYSTAHLVEQILRDGHMSLKAAKMRMRDGVLRTLDMTCVRSVLNGHPCLVTLLDDVTDKQRAEEALVASEARYRELVEELGHPILSVDKEGTIVFVNRAVSSFGYVPEELRGRKFEDLLPPEDRGNRQRFQDAMRIAQTTTTPLECRIVDAKGRSRTIRMTPRPIWREDQVIGFTSLMIDLTAQRESEQQLRTSQRMEAVGRLAGGVAHDFNNLLTVILTNADFVRAELPEGSELTPLLDETLLASKRAEGLTRQLLAFSRRQVMALESLSVTDVVRGVSTMLGRLIGEDIWIETRMSDALPHVIADRGQLEQVVMNLAINSRDAMPDGGRLVFDGAVVCLDEHEAVALEATPGKYLELSVRDTGTGMDEETRQRIFEPFFTTKGVGKGTGLGLSTVYGIVRQFRGGIAVTTAPGKGTTFRVYLPVANELGTPLTTRTRAPVDVARGSETVLVVEDDSAVRTVLRRLLEGAGYRAVLARNADEALEIVRQRPTDIDVLLSDVIMPRMNGRQLFERMHEIAPKMKVIFMSGYTDEAIERCDVLGSNFLRKPFTLDELRSILRTVLDDKKAATHSSPVANR